MSKFKFAASILMAIVMVATLSAPLSAHAATSTPEELIWLPVEVVGSPLIPLNPPAGIIEIAPFWQNVSSAQVSISASGRTLRPGLAIVATNSNQRITGTLFLERRSGSTWVNVTSWSVSGTGRLMENKSYTGTTGVTYRARIVVTVGSDRIERTSSSVML